MAIIAFSGLTACGDGSNDSTANQGPQGLWIGTTNTGYDLATIVLENGDYYSLYSQDEIIIGANYGNIITTDNAFIGTLKDIYVPNNNNCWATPFPCIEDHDKIDMKKFGLFKIFFKSKL